MHRVNRSVLVAYSDAQMYALVRDVERYPQFLPWCPSTSVRPLGEGGDLEARVDIAYLGVRSHFTTHNVHQAPGRIELRLLDGPFRHLQGNWTFRALGPDACKVSLELEYSFGAGLLGRVVAPVFERVANSLIDAFAERAQSLYGRDPS